MTINLTNKEKMLLQDQKAHEELCVQKYQNYSSQAQDPKLQQLFASLAQKEQQHLDTINQIINGQVPNLQQNNTNSNQSQQDPLQQMMQQTKANPVQGAMANQNDKTLCNDMLATEKYISGTYNTAIFEFTNPNVRQVLNHIQKEEQEHGEQIFNYMQSNGMYNPQ